MKKKASDLSIYFYGSFISLYSYNILANGFNSNPLEYLILLVLASFAFLADYFKEFGVRKARFLFYLVLFLGVSAYLPQYIAVPAFLFTSLYLLNTAVKKRSFHPLKELQVYKELTVTALISLLSTFIPIFLVYVSYRSSSANAVLKSLDSLAPKLFLPSSIPLILGGALTYFLAKICIRPGNSKSIYIPILGSFVSLTVMAYVNSLGYTSPVLLKKLIHGTIHYDEAFHLAIAKGFETFNIPTTGLHGADTFIWYHHGYHSVMAGLAKVTLSSAIGVFALFTNILLWPTVSSLMMAAIKRTENIKLFHYLIPIFVIAYIGPHIVLSESASFAWILMLLQIIIYKEWVDKQNSSLFHRDSVLLIVAGLFAKISFGYTIAAYYIFKLIHLRFKLKVIFLAAISSAFLVVIYHYKFKVGYPSSNIKTDAYYLGFFNFSLLFSVVLKTAPIVIGIFVIDMLLNKKKLDWSDLLLKQIGIIFLLPILVYFAARVTNGSNLFYIVLPSYLLGLYCFFDSIVKSKPAIKPQIVLCVVTVMYFVIVNKKEFKQPIVNLLRHSKVDMGNKNSAIEVKHGFLADIRKSISSITPAQKRRGLGKIFKVIEKENPDYVHLKYSTGLLNGHLCMKTLFGLFALTGTPHAYGLPFEEKSTFCYKKRAGYSFGFYDRNLYTTGKFSPDKVCDMPRAERILTVDSYNPFQYELIDCGQYGRAHQEGHSPN